jgi:hypothetical protein
MIGENHRPLLLAKTEEAEARLKRLRKSIDLKRKLLQTSTESWLSRHGKSQYIQFTKEKKKNLRNCFLSIDINGSKSIELEEIIEAMMTLGIAENKVQAKKIFEDVDIDGSGHIEFNEFCNLLKEKNPKVKALNELFQNVVEKKMGIQSEFVPFQVVVSNYRRKMMMNAIMQPGDPKEELILKSTSKVFARKFQKIRMNIKKGFQPRNSLKNVMRLSMKKLEEGE